MGSANGMVEQRGGPRPPETQEVAMLQREAYHLRSVLRGRGERWSDASSCQGTEIDIMSLADHS